MTNSDTPNQLFYAKVLSLIGAFFLSFPDGALWSWGNMSVYMLSYVRMTGLTSSSTDSPWLLSFYFVAWAAGLTVAGLVSKVLGRRLTLLLGVLVQDGGYFLSYLAIQHSLGALNVTQGAMTGLGCGIIYAMVFLYIVDWADNNKGLVTSIVTSATTVGGALNIQVTSHLANPDNKTPNLRLGPIMYFTQTDVITNVPRVYIVLGAICVAFHCVGLFLVRSKPEPAIQDTVVHSLNENNERTKFQTGTLTSEYGKDRDISTSSGVGIIVAENNKIQTQLSNGSHVFNKNQVNTVNTGIQTSSDGSNSSSSNSSCSSSSNSSDSTAGDEEKTSSPRSKTNPIVDYTPCEMLRHRLFYILFILLLCNEFGLVIFSNYYKTFGELFIINDHELADMGTAITVSVAISRVAWGAMIDRLGAKWMMMACSSAFVILFSFYFFTPIVSPWLYYCWSITFACVNSSLLSNFSLATLRYFGPKHLAINVGLVMSASIVLNFGAPPLIGFLLDQLGWFALFFISALVNFLALLMIVFGLPEI